LVPNLYILLIKANLSWEQVEGITIPVMQKALLQANAGRRHILGKINLTIPINLSSRKLSEQPSTSGLWLQFFF
jgi:polyribonucleotide nucleotidyltransferase